MSPMKPINTTCPECGGEMQEGFLLDNTYGAKLPVSWVEGPPVPSVWVGTKTAGKKRWQVESYRCDDCGLVKSYARKKTG